jgi:terminase, large subunit
MTTIAPPLSSERVLLRADTSAVCRRGFTVPPPLTVSEWADAYRYLSPESSAEPGRWSTDRTPYLREVMDAFTIPTVHEIVFMKSARIGGTEAGLNVLGYFIHLDPCPVLMVLPTVDDAKQFSKEQLAPMIRDTPVIAKLVRDPTSRDSGNTIQGKTFPGGIWVGVGANSGTGFRRRTIRFAHLSEVDGFPPSAGTEGDQIKLTKKRTETYADYKLYMESTPKVKGLSRIADAFENSDQRHYHVPCPECGFFQALKWEQMQWNDIPEPMYGCEGCGVLIPEAKKFRMVARGKWVSHNPHHRVRGYHINALYSPFPGARWANLVAEYQEAQGAPEKMKTFVNLTLGLPYEMPGGVDPSRLSERKERYVAPVPKGVGVLTMGIDVQADRLEAVVKGWGVGEESWLVDRFALQGDTSASEVWTRLTERWEYAYPCEVGGTMQVDSTAIDFGFNAEMVMRWAKPKHGRKVYAVKGSSEAGKAIAPRRATVKMKHGGRGYMIGTDTAKDLIFARMRIQPHRDGSPVPGLMHFPDEEWCDADYFAQLTSEKPVKELIRGVYRRRYVCPEGVRNEALDLEVYAVAAFYLGGLKPEQLVSKVARVEAKAEAAKVEAEKPKVQEPEETEEERVFTPRPRVQTRRSGFVNRWKL